MSEQLILPDKDFPKAERVVVSLDNGESVRFSREIWEPDYGWTEMGMLRLSWDEAVQVSGALRRWLGLE